MVRVVVCSECNTKNEYIAGVFVKCYFCQCINFVGYPYFGKSFQCIRVLCPSCISYTIVPKDTQICRCFTCGLLQYTGVVIKNEDETDETSSKSHSPESIPQSGERELDKQDGELIYRFGAAETKGMGNLENNKKLVLEELKEKYQGPKLPHETHNTPKYTTNNSTETLNPNPFLN